MQLCNMAETEKEEVAFPACATLWQGNLHKVAAPYFLSFIYIVQLYEEDWVIAYVGLSGRSSPQYRADSQSLMRAKKTMSLFDAFLKPLYHRIVLPFSPVLWFAL